MSITYTPLTHRAVLAVSGEDARPFLQGLITNDINKVSETQAIFAALLSPQGKFLFDFFIIEHQGRLLFDIEKTRLAEFVKRLGMYRLRSKVEFTPLENLYVTAMSGGDTDSKDICFIDPRLGALGVRIISEGPVQADELGDYEQQRLTLGVPDGAKDLVTDRSLPLEYGYDELNAVDYTKGCYVGQEVTARTKHRATLRKFIHQVKGAGPLPPSGTAVMANGHEIGNMCSSLDGIGLAVLRVAEANGALISDGITLEACLPPWCKTSFAEEAK